LPGPAGGFLSNFGGTISFSLEKGCILFRRFFEHCQPPSCREKDVLPFFFVFQNVDPRPFFQFLVGGIGGFLPGVFSWLFSLECRAPSLFVSRVFLRFIRPPHLLPLPLDKVHAISALVGFSSFRFFYGVSSVSWSPSPRGPRRTLSEPFGSLSFSDSFSPPDSPL